MIPFNSLPRLEKLGVKHVWIACSHHCVRCASHIKKSYNSSSMAPGGIQPTTKTNKRMCVHTSGCFQSHYWVFPGTLHAKSCHPCSVMFKFIAYIINEHNKIVFLCAKISVICQEAKVNGIPLTIQLTFPIIKSNTYADIQKIIIESIMKYFKNK